MLSCSTPTLASKVSRHIQSTPNVDHSALIEEVVQLTLLNPYEVLDSKYVDALKMFAASDKLDYKLNITLSEDVADTGIVLMYIRSLLNQIKTNPVFINILVIIGKYMPSPNKSGIYQIDSYGFYEILNQASLHGVSDIFNCFNKLASLNLEFQVLDFIDGKIIKSKEVKTPLFESFELASNAEITDCMSNPLHKGNLLSVSFTPLITTIIETVICNPDSFTITSSNENCLLNDFIEATTFS